MKDFYQIIHADYLQRTRSYAFLITLAISLYFAYFFLPAPSATYTTVKIGNYVGVPNSAWMAYVTAMMSSTFIGLIGFYLVNSNIKKDIDTGVGMIIATTAITNFQYLLAKTWSNFLVLTSILGCSFIMTIALFFIRHTGYPFEPLQFILPFILIPIPTIFFISVLAVVGEVFLYRFGILLNIGYFFFFCMLVSLQLKMPPNFDILGVRQATSAMEQTVLVQQHQKSTVLSIGFNLTKNQHPLQFVFEGVNWSFAVILGRVLLVSLGFLLVYISARYFHRFDTIEVQKTIKNKKLAAQTSSTHKVTRDIKLVALPPIITSYRITPFIKTELLMLYRKGPKWLWLLNIGGMVALLFVTLNITHQIILPVLWFLQVARWSDIATREKTNRIHYFTFASYRPLTRLLPAQLFAGIILALFLASPLLIRYALQMQLLAVISIVLGGVIIVLSAVALGILSGGKKLFEILFLLFTYANVNLIPIADYFGGENHGIQYTLSLLTIISFLTLLSFGLRRREIKVAG